MPSSIAAQLHVCSSHPLLQIDETLGTLRTFSATGCLLWHVSSSRCVASRGLNVISVGCIQEIRRHQSEYKLNPDYIYWKLNRPVLFDRWYGKFASVFRHVSTCLNRDEWQLHAPAALPLMKTVWVPGGNQKYGWKGKIVPPPHQKSNSSHTGHHFTDWGVLVHYLEQLNISRQ